MCAWPLIGGARSTTANAHTTGWRGKRRGLSYLLSLFDLVDRISGYIMKYLHQTTGPSNLNLLDHGIAAETEV